MEQESSLPVGAKLPRSARRLARFACLLAWLIPPAVLVQYLFFDASFIPTPYGIAGLLSDFEWSVSSRLLASIAALLPALAVTLALVSVSRICREYAEGRLFSNGVVSAYRRLGLLLMTTTCLHWLQPTFLGLLLSLTLPPGKRFLTIGVSSDDLLLLLVTGMVYMLALVMQVAQRVQAENAEIV